MPVFSVFPLRDSNFEVNGVRKAVAEAWKIYELLGAGENLLVEYPDSVRISQFALHSSPRKI